MIMMKVPCNTHLSIVVTDFLPLDDKASRTIPVKQFPGYVKLLHSDRDSSFEDHFQVIMYTGISSDLSHSHRQLTSFLRALI